MSVYKYDDKVCPSCDRAALAHDKAGAWTCVEKRSGCGKTWPAGTKTIEEQPHTTWRYRKRVKLPDGRTERISGKPMVNTRKAAEDAERAHVERVLNPPKAVVERRKMSDVFDRFMAIHTAEANNKESERASKKSAIDFHLRPALGHLFLDQVDDEQVSELAAKLLTTPKANGKPRGAKTVKNILQTLRKTLNWAKRMKWIVAVPEIHMPRLDEAEIRFLEDAELDALLETASAEPLWYAAVVLAADAGLRKGELRALQWTDINEVTNQVVVSRSRWRNTEGSPKSRKPRAVPLTSRARAALKAIRATRLRGPYVFSGRTGKPFGSEYVGEVMDRLSRNAKLTDCGWHTLRHTFCTRLAMRGAPVTTIQKLAGHANLATTMRYMHVVKGALDAAIALLDDGPREGHGSDSTSEIDIEVGEVIELRKATPTGFEPSRKDRR